MLLAVGTSFWVTIVIGEFFFNRLTSRQPSPSRSLQKLKSS